jgi:hypothetical protein
LYFGVICQKYYPPMGYKFRAVITIKIESGVIVAVITAFTRELHIVRVINYALIADRERLMNLISGILFIRIHLV